MQSDESVVPAGEFKALQQQVKELQRLLRKKTWRTRFSRKPWSLPGQKMACALAVIDGRRYPVAVVCRTLSVACSPIAQRRSRRAPWRDRRDHPPVEPQVLAQLPKWFADYNQVHPHSALKYRSPEEFRQA